MMDSDKERDGFPNEVDVDAVILEFKGDLREAIRGLLHDIAILAADYDADVSRGYIRGELPRSVQIMKGAR